MATTKPAGTKPPATRKPATKRTTKSQTKWQKFWSSAWSGVKKFFVWIWANLVTILLVIALIIGIYVLLAFLRTFTSTQSGYIVPETPIVSEQVQEPVVIVQEKPVSVYSESKPIYTDNKDTLESPNERSAHSNENFIGYWGNPPMNYSIPEKVLDTENGVQQVGSGLYTWCERMYKCYFQVLQPGETIQWHSGGELNLYSPEYAGLEFNELQYIQPAQTDWTAHN